MITTNVPVLRIHELSKEQYLREKEAGKLDPAIYITPDEEPDTTLSIGGRAADAKAVGEALANLELTPGLRGEDGEDGISCTHKWNGTVLTVTSASGTSSADLKGDKGDPGESGTYMGDKAPINNDINVWIDTSENIETENFIYTPNKAEKNQFLMVSAIDDNNFPIEWKTSNITTKTDEMTNPVGVDELGGLWSAAASGGGHWRLARTLTVENVVINIQLTEDDDGNPLDCKEVIIAWENPVPEASTYTYLSVRDGANKILEGILPAIGYGTRTISLWSVRRVGDDCIFMEGCSNTQYEWNMSAPLSRTTILGNMGNIKKVEVRTDGRYGIAVGATLKLYVREDA
jgi:hypothetical protein